ncbi:hypothetical protein [Actinomadura yumaensis]|uniref:Uncharacterized protein n=1 Tax=Actinomadura yumaensis TaxID=111807 RepID=A0ABW2CBW4_9ACTN
MLMAACDGPADPRSHSRSRAVMARARLILVLGWATMVRRGEVAALDLPDVGEVPQGLEVIVRRSKVD